MKHFMHYLVGLNRWVKNEMPSERWYKPSETRSADDPAKLAQWRKFT